MWSEQNVAEPGRLVILSGPSGAGKSTVVRQLLTGCPLPLMLSVSATTRSPRAGEVDGLDYHFLSHEEFAKRRNAGEFSSAKKFLDAATGMEPCDKLSKRASRPANG